MTECDASSESGDSSIVEASFSFAPAAYCMNCGVRCALRISASRSVCPLSVADQFTHTTPHQRFDGEVRSLMDPNLDNASASPSVIHSISRSIDRSMSTMEVARAVEEDLPSYYEHLSISLLMPESPEEVPSPSCRRKPPKPFRPALPLPDHMSPIGDFLDGVTAYVEVRTNLGDHSGPLAALLFRMGASIAASLNPSVTHAVLSNARPSTTKRVKSLGVRTVAARWAMACMDELRKVEEDQWPVIDQATQDTQRRVRQYLYQVNGLRETSSPVSVSNLARLSKQRRRDAGGVSSGSELEFDITSPIGKRQDNPTTSEGSPKFRGGPKWTLPRKSLRRMVFKNVDVNHQNADSDASDGSFEGIEHLSEVTVEVPETQIPPLSPMDDAEVWVPETDPLLLCPQSDIEDSDDLEIPETQPEPSTTERKATRTCGIPNRRLDFGERDSAATSASSMEKERTVLEVASRLSKSRQSVMATDIANAISDERFHTIEASFGELNVSADTSDAQLTRYHSSKYDPVIQELTQVFSDVSIDSDRNQLYSEELPFILELPSGISQSQGQVVHHDFEPDSTRNPQRSSISLNIDIAQQVPKNDRSLLISGSSDRESISSLSRRSIPDSTINDTSARHSVNDIPAASEEIGLLNDDEIRGYDIVAEPFRRQEVSMVNAELANTEPSISVTKIIGQQRNEEQATSVNNKTRHSPSKCSDPQWPSCSTADRQIEPHKVNANNELREEQRGVIRSKGSVPSSESIGDLSTPAPIRRARVSGVFSDDDSPCIDTRRTVVLTAVKNKTLLSHSLSRLASKTLRRQKQQLPTGDIGPLMVATEVTTKTEVVVLGRRKRTLSVLLGIGWGCWFVDTKWVTACIKECRWLDPAPFEISDFLPPMVTNRHLRNSHTSGRRPLQGVAVFISRKRSLNPPAEGLQRMVLQAAGKIVYDPHRADVYVGKRRPTRTLQCPCVSPHWIVETVATGSRQCEQDFLL